MRRLFVPRGYRRVEESFVVTGLAAGEELRTEHYVGPIVAQSRRRLEIAERNCIHSFPT
jgi:hypothetical protein